MKSACKYSILYLNNFFVAWSSKLLVGFFCLGGGRGGEGRYDFAPRIDFNRYCFWKRKHLNIKH